jgi:transcriptional regulator with XRE-family HTH domain
MVFILICPNREAKRGHPILNDSSLASETLGAKIRRLRSEIGIGQERLAIESHVDQSGLSKFERGKDNRALSEAALRRIAITLGTSFENLVDGTDYPPRQS